MSRKNNELNRDAANAFRSLLEAARTHGPITIEALSEAHFDVCWIEDDGSLGHTHIGVPDTTYTQADAIDDLGKLFAQLTV